MKYIKLQKQNVGNAGEYYIASRLSALDFIVTITLGNAVRYDILALSPQGKLIKISVKTTQVDSAKGFPLSPKDESGEANDFYYAFVKLYNFSRDPDFWIIPSNVVCPIIKKNHNYYLRTPGKHQRKHIDNPMRKLNIENGKKRDPSYPADWAKEVNLYYKNLKQLKNL